MWLPKFHIQAKMRYSRRNEVWCSMVSIMLLPIQSSVSVIVRVSELYFFSISHSLVEIYFSGQPEPEMIS